MLSDLLILPFIKTFTRELGKERFSEVDQPVIRNNLSRATGKKTGKRYFGHASTMM
jgi:hypothetical protein